VAALAGAEAQRDALRAGAPPRGTGPQCCRAMVRACCPCWWIVQS